MTQDEHLVWCKQRALEYLARGEVQNAIASMMSDYNQHPDCKMNPILQSVGLLAAMHDDVHAARRFIEGFR
jgi:hypothetical protein